MIPKIIHQTAYSNKKEWHPVWSLCHDSVKKNFKEFKHYLWTDEQINNFIKENFKEHYNDFSTIPFHIIQLDLFRYALLLKYGGTYIDMDMYCYENFYKSFTSEINIVESDCLDEFGQVEQVQNSLMAATPNNEFFKECFLEGLQRSKKVKFKEKIHDNHFNIKFVSGPVLLRDMIKKFKKNYIINILPIKYFNTTSNYLYEKHHKVRHMASGMWGKEIQEMFKNLQEAENFVGTIEDYHKASYLDKTKININKLNFFETYKFE